jgi:hypothetical protein
VRKPQTFTKCLNYGALLLFAAAVVALCFTHRVPASTAAAARAPASSSK